MFVVHLSRERSCHSVLFVQSLYCNGNCIMIIILCDVLTLCFTVNLYEKKNEDRLFWCFDISCKEIIHVSLCRQKILEKKFNK